MADDGKSEDLAYRNGMEDIEEGLSAQTAGALFYGSPLCTRAFDGFCFGGLYVNQTDLYTDWPRWVHDQLSERLS